MRLLALFIYLGCFRYCAARTDDNLYVGDTTHQQHPFMCVFEECLPSFPGGEDSMMRFMAHNLCFPKFEADHCISGKVIASFTVDTTGCVYDIKIYRSLHPLFDREVLRVLALLPNFRVYPCMKQDVQYFMPVKFALAE